MQFYLNKNQKSTLLEQAREQLLTALHIGKLRAGDRLPSVRQVAQRNNINIKSAFSIYQRLKNEGYIELRTGSGAYVSNIERVDLDQAYCLSIFKLIKSNLSQANQLKLDPQRYSSLVRNFVAKSWPRSVQVAIVECNEEQVNLFASEISNRLNVRVCPILLSQLERPDSRAARLLTRTDYFVTTDYHFRQVKDLAGKYKKKILQLRLNPAFVAEIVAAARRGRLLMIVSNTSFFAAFRHHLKSIETPPDVIDRITAIDDTSLARLRAAAMRAQAVYISPICDPRVRKLIPSRVKQVKIESMLSLESIEILEAVMLFHTDQPGR